MLLIGKKCVAPGDRRNSLPRSLQTSSLEIVKNSFLFYLGLFPIALRKFSENAFTILLAFFVFIVVSVVPNIIPLLGMVASLILTAIMLIGMWGFMLRIVDGQKAEVGNLFEHTKLWLHASLAHLVATLATGLAVALVIGLAALLGSRMGEAGNVIIPLVFMPAVLVVAMLFGFWPAFVSDQKRNPFDALGDSFKFVLANVPAMLAVLVVIFGASVVGLLLIALIAQASETASFLLGFIWFLVAGPVIALMLAMVFRKLAPTAPAPIPDPTLPHPPPAPQG